jgi:hypothetical protein
MADLILRAVSSQCSSNLYLLELFLREASILGCNVSSHIAFTSCSVGSKLGF